MRACRLAALLLAALAAPLLAAAAVPAARPPPKPKPTWWRPRRYNRDGSLLRWQYQLSDGGSVRYVPGVQVGASSCMPRVPPPRQRQLRQPIASSPGLHMPICIAAPLASTLYHCCCP